MQTDETDEEREFVYSLTPAQRITYWNLKKENQNPKSNTLEVDGARILLHKSAQWYVKELGRKNGTWGTLENAVSRLENAAIQFAESGAKPMNHFNPKIIKHD